MKKNIDFKIKSTISFLVFLSFFFLAFSGIVLYFKPEGSIARWIGWNLFGIDKTGWESIHILFSILFILLVIFHLFYNWKILTGYVFNKAAGGIRLKKEISAALLISVGFLLLAVIQINPLNKILELRASVKKGKHILKIAPPVQDFDRMSLSDAAEVLNISIEELTNIFEKKGWKIENKDITISKFAKNNGLSPEKIYSEILKNVKSSKKE